MKHAREDYDCIQDPSGKIPEDEPVFLIRAQDVNGWKAVNYWADKAEQSGSSKDIVKRARELAARMRKWPKKKTADLPVV